MHPPKPASLPATKRLFTRRAGALSYRLLPGLCLRCHLPSDRPLDFCRGCESDLVAVGPCCARCSLPYSADLPPATLCGSCLTTPPPFHRVRAGYRYQAPLTELVLALKNNGDLAVATVLGQLLAIELSRQLSNSSLPDVLVPVPLHWRRRLSRGYNQSVELARPLANALSLPIATGLVSRTHHLTQQGLRRQARRRQLRRAFRVNGNVSNLHIAVIDDVVTTTGTVRGVAESLLAAGARSVEVWCLARTPLEK